MRISDWSSDLCSSDLFVQELTRGTDQLVDRLDHVDGNADCSRLIGDGSRNRLPDPPRGVSAELIPPAILKFIDRLHQADIALLDKIQKLTAALDRKSVV